MKSKRTISLMLALMMLLFPLCVFAEGEQTDETLNMKFLDGFDVSEIEREIIDERTAHTKTYLLKNGNYRYVDYSNKIHYEDSAGDLQEIDSTLVAAGAEDDFAYTNAANDLNICFYDVADDNTATLSIDGYEVSLEFASDETANVYMQAGAAVLQGTAMEEEVPAESSVTYYNAYGEGIHAVYTATDLGVMENIVLTEPTENTSFSSVMHLEGLTPDENEQGTLVLVDEDDEEKFKLSSGVAIDDAETMEPLTRSIMQPRSAKPGTYTVTTTVDEEWLNDEEREFPVVVDPDVTISAENVVDTYVSSSHPERNYSTENFLIVANKTSYMSYLRFKLPVAIPSSNVTSAYLRLRMNGSYSTSMRAHRIYNETDATPIRNIIMSSITYETRPYYSTTNYSGTSEVVSGTSWCKMTLNNVTKIWLNGTHPNYGVVVREIDDNSTKVSSYYSQDYGYPNRPELVIEYTGKTSASSSIGAYSYENFSTKVNASANCAGFALRHNAHVNFHISEIGSLCEGLGSLTSITNKCIEHIIDDLEEYHSSYGLTVYDYIGTTLPAGNLESGEYLAAVRFYFNDADGNKIYTGPALGLGDSIDYHWYVRTNDGSWCNKQNDKDPYQINGSNKDFSVSSYGWHGDGDGFTSMSSIELYDGPVHYFVFKKSNYGNNNFTS